MTPHAGLVLAQILAERNVPRVFSVPGESFLAALDGFYETGIPNIVCRHEGAAAMMAEATGKLTQRPGIAFVTRGPGATNASAGVHVAQQDSTPMILFVGQIARGHRDRDAFQEVDYRAMYGPLAKWVAEIDDAARLPEYVNRAFHVAMSGRPGPVVLSLPEDMLSGPCAAPRLAQSAPVAAAIAPDIIADLHRFVLGARNPLLVVGGSLWSHKAAADLQSYAEAMALPVAVSMRRQDYLDNASPSYIGDLGVGGNPKLAARLRAADRLLVIGARLSDIATGGFTDVDPANPRQEIAHIHPDPNLPGSVFRTELAVTAQGAEVVSGLAGLGSPGPGTWTGWTQSARRDYETWQQPQATPGAVKLEQVIAWLSEHLPDDAILTNGAGNYSVFLHRYFRYRRYGTQIAPTSGSMGYAVPGAIAASLYDPARTVVSLTGDGCFQMTLNEMSTAMQFGATPIFIVANNGRYGTIRAHQEHTFPGRISGTDLTNPDFAALARSYGAYGETVETTEDFPAAFASARDSRRLAVIELKLDPDMLATGTNLSDLSPKA